jgi:ribosomal protein L37AE/L43A
MDGLTHRVILGKGQGQFDLRYTRATTSLQARLAAKTEAQRKEQECERQAVQREECGRFESEKAGGLLWET